MKTNTKQRVHSVYLILKEGMPIMIFIMLIFFGAAIVGFQQDNRSLLRDTKTAAQNTETIVSKQDQTLTAIKNLSLDNKLTSKQLGDTIICMLLVPVGQRTTQTQEDCRKEAVVRTPASAISGSTSEQPAKSSPTPVPAPTPTPTPKPTPTPETQPVKVLGIPVCIPFTGVCVSK